MEPVITDGMREFLSRLRPGQEVVMVEIRGDETEEERELLVRRTLDAVLALLPSLPAQEGER